VIGSRGGKEEKEEKKMAIPSVEVANRVTLVSLEITGRCQLACVHCYAESGPHGTHGIMTRADWLAVIDQATAMGCIEIQLIGGEPTLHPDLPGLVVHTLWRRASRWRSTPIC
jgi:MoaA/NifB/PqqE/SkfB family radical SAM enzyme